MQGSLRYSNVREALQQVLWFGVLLQLRLEPLDLVSLVQWKFGKPLFVPL